jgi:hypothetical protein
MHGLEILTATAVAGLFFYLQPSILAIPQTADTLRGS